MLLPVGFRAREGEINKGFDPRTTVDDPYPWASVVKGATIPHYVKLILGADAPLLELVVVADGSDHYIGRQETPPPAEWWFNPELHGPITGMINGQAVDFEPKDLNETGVVAGQPN
jgi:hypothetical protein